METAMTLLMYQVLKTVTEQGSFRKAAELLGLTPSAISHTVASLEGELGFPVLNRSKSGVTLTDYGERLLPYVNAVLNSNESLQQKVVQFNGLEQGTVKLGCFSSTCTNWIPDILHSFHKLYPGIVIEVLQGTYDDVVYWIKNGVVDMGFLSASSAGDLSIVPLYKDPLLCVMPQNMERHGDGEYIGIDEMKTYPFVAQRESTDADIQNFLKGSALDVHAKYHVVDDLAMVSMVAHGFGICIMPEMVMKDIPYEVKCYPIKPEAYRIVGLATQNSEFMAPAVSTMYQYIIEHYKQKDEVDV